MKRCYLGLGSNLGDRAQYLRSAIELLKSHPQLWILKEAPLIETKPWGNPDQPDFLNSVVECETTLNPKELLFLCLETEKKLGRKRNAERWTARTIDIDILSYGDELIHEQDLIIPHPRIQERSFVLIPWHSLAPHYIVPGLGVTIQQLYEKSEIQ